MTDWMCQRAQKYKIGEKRRKKNKYGVLEYTVTIVSAEYDSFHHKWMYTLKDVNGRMVDGETPETHLG